MNLKGLQRKAKQLIDTPAGSHTPATDEPASPEPSADPSSPPDASKPKHPAGA